MLMNLQIGGIYTNGKHIRAIYGRDGDEVIYEKVYGDENEGTNFQTEGHRWPHLFYFTNLRFKMKESKFQKWAKKRIRTDLWSFDNEHKRVNVSKEMKAGNVTAIHCNFLMTAWHKPLMEVMNGTRDKGSVDPEVQEHGCRFAH